MNTNPKKLSDLIYARAYSSEKELVRKAAKKNKMKEAEVIRHLVNKGIARDGTLKI